MRIGLHDAEQEYMRHKTFPNYALMKISAYHKARGDCESHPDYKNNRAVHAVANIKRVYDDRLIKHDFL